VGALGERGQLVGERVEQRLGRPARRPAPVQVGGRGERRQEGGHPGRGGPERAQAPAAGLAPLGDGSYAAPAKTTVGAFLTDEWLPAVTRTLRPMSAAKYE
jgi:hypothetical protein